MNLPGNAVISVMQGIILLILAPLLGITLSPLIVAELIGMLILLSIPLSGLGVLIASRMKSQQGFQIIIQIVIFPLMFLYGIFFRSITCRPGWK
jgi:ABC-2 type transport system permease protein